MQPCTCRGNGNSESNSNSGYPWEGGTVWVGRTRRKPPFRGPAQPLAAVRSGACEAVLRKQSALTHGGSMAPSMAPTVLPTHTAPPLTDFCSCW
ncbi:conserved hypothetical protein [Stenotrophomonas maltophilia]|nr:conserved hypothetical protein [Stenotrophomonas maltophilia]